MHPLSPMKSSFTIGRVNIFATMEPFHHNAIEGRAEIKAVDAFDGEPATETTDAVPPRPGVAGQPAIEAREAWVEDRVETRFEFAICQGNTPVEIRSGEMDDDIVKGWRKMPLADVIVALTKNARKLV